MPKIILTQPFIRHYAGSVFLLSDAVGYSGWDEDDRVRDRQPCHDKRVYTLPDNGKGLLTELPVSYTIICPENIFNNQDLKSGPCRITSVSKSLETQQNDPYDAYPLPLGKGKVLLNNSHQYSKNLITADISPDNPFNKSVIHNLVTEEREDIVYNFPNGFQLDFSNLDPGFYKVDILYNTTLLHYFTVIKNFPLVVQFEKNTWKFKTSQTLW
ncbi:MAG: hypothetical protein IPM42_13555 [Saprospiraceae bacterium]|nr:hypothetical protein [Saprospiraceae bacterium]